MRYTPPPPRLLGDTEAASAHDDYDGSNSGGDERMKLAEDDDSDLYENFAGQCVDIGNWVREYAGLQLGKDTENRDEDSEGDLNMTGMMGPEGHWLRETTSPQYGIPSQKEGEPLLEASGKKGKGDTTSLDPKILLERGLRSRPQAVDFEGRSLGERGRHCVGHPLRTRPVRYTRQWAGGEICG